MTIGKATHSPYLTCLGVEIVVGAKLNGQYLAFVPGIDQNLLHRLALPAPHPFRLQQIAQRVCEGPLHEDVGGLIGTDVSTERGYESRPRTAVINCGLVRHQR